MSQDSKLGEFYGFPDHAHWKAIRHMTSNFTHRYWDMKTAEIGSKKFLGSKDLLAKTNLNY